MLVMNNLSKAIMAWLNKRFDLKKLTVVRATYDECDIFDEHKFFICTIHFLTDTIQCNVDIFDEMNHFISVDKNEFGEVFKSWLQIKFNIERFTVLVY